MLRLAALALFAIILGTIPGARAATEAMAFPTTHLNCFAWCIRYPPQNDNDLQPFPIGPPGGEEAAPDIRRCDDHTVPDCANRAGDARLGDPQQADRYLDTTISTDNYLESKAFDLNIQIRESDLSKGTRNCLYIEGEADNPKPGNDSCRNVQPGSDYTDTVSVLTIALITVVTLAAITFAWMMHRSYRIWRLRRFGTVAR